MRCLPVTTAVLLPVLLLLPCSRLRSQHHPGERCSPCHAAAGVGGTVFASYAGGATPAGVPAALVAMDGSRVTLPATDTAGRLFAPAVPDGDYLVQLGAVRSRSWHGLPARRDCNACHEPGGNASAERTKTLPALHTELSRGNACLPCHFFPASMAYAQLRTPGTLHGAAPAPAVQGSRVVLPAASVPFSYDDTTVTALRGDVFSPGYFSFFDAILAAARRAGVRITYHWDDSCATHFIDSVDGVAGDWWYRYSYDAGSGTQNELQNRRQDRWDEMLFQPGAWVQLTSGEDLAGLRREFHEEIARERRFGHSIPQVQISLAPSDYRGNPPESGRVTVQRTFTNVAVGSHALRLAGSDSLHRMPFRPGVVTAIDVLYSLVDAGQLTMTGSVFFTRLAGKVMDSYRVREIGFPGAGVAHASGSQGFVYTTGNGTPQRMANNAARTQHIHADINVIHAPDFAQWRWTELGNPYYEATDPTGIEEINADHDARDRGFRLQRPFPAPGGTTVFVSANVFDPGSYRIDLYAADGARLSTLFEGDIPASGIRRFTLDVSRIASGTYFLRMSGASSVDIQSVRVLH